MASDTTQIFIDLIARDKASKQLAKSAFALGAVGLAAAKFAKDSVKASLEAEDAQNNLAIAYQKFPKLADVSLQSLDDLAMARQRDTIFSDEQTKAAEAQLALFNLTGKQVEALTPLIQDLARKQGIDLVTAAGQVGKVFLGNTRVLKSVGISYKATGDTATDFTNIQALLNEKVGGFAEKQGKTAGDQAEILKNQYNELQETVGAALVPALSALVQVITPVLEAFTALPKPVQEIVVGVTALSVATAVVVPRIAAVKAGLAELGIIGRTAAAATSGVAVAEAEAGVASTAFLGPVGLLVGVLGLAAGAALLFAHRTQDEVKPLGSVTDALHESRDAYLANIRAKQADALLTAENIKTLRESGVSIGLVNAALAGNRSAQQVVNSLLDAAIAKHTHLTNVVAGKAGASTVRAMDDFGRAAKAVEGQFGGLNAQIGADAAQWDYLNGRVSAASTTLTRAIALGQGAHNAARASGHARIPGFASGGVVPGPVGSAQLAVVHGGERVLTASQANSGATGGVVVQQLVINNTGPELDEQAIVRGLQRFQRANARRWQTSV